LCTPVTVEMFAGITTIADISEAAEVAPRTVATYFPSKQDIAMARFGATVDSLTSVMRALPPGDNISEAIGQWLRAYEAAADSELGGLAQRRFAANPELNALRSARMAVMVDLGAGLVARETGAAGRPGAADRVGHHCGHAVLDAGIAALSAAWSTTARSV
jgi:AcrR family transcriptional regulator